MQINEKLISPSISMWLCIFHKDSEYENVEKIYNEILTYISWYIQYFTYLFRFLTNIVFFVVFLCMANVENLKLIQSKISHKILLNTIKSQQHYFVSILYLKNAFSFLFNLSIFTPIFLWWHQTTPPKNTLPPLKCCPLDYP